MYAMPNGLATFVSKPHCRQLFFFSISSIRRGIPNSSDSTSRPADQLASFKIRRGKRALLRSGSRPGRRKERAMGEKVKQQALLPATASKKDKQPWFPPMLMWSVAVQEVLKWALCTAIIVAVAVGITATNSPTPCSQTSKFFQCPDLTPAQDAKAESFTEGLLWFTVPQAAAATVGLLLPRRRARSRWYLAFLAIVSATVAHYMLARGSFVFIAANPGDIAFDILSGGGSVFLLTQDLLAILSLLVGGAE